MKTLILMRHGKSSWEDFSLPDEKRPLLPKGKARTKKVATFLRHEGISIDCVIHSHARRAKATAEILAEAYKLNKQNILEEKQIYFRGTEAVKSIIYALDNKIDYAAFVGHNPDFTYLTNEFLTESIANLPTSGTVVIQFQTHHWNEIDTAKFDVLHLIIPKLLND